MAAAFYGSQRVRSWAPPQYMSAVTDTGGQGKLVSGKTIYNLLSLTVEIFERKTAIDQLYFAICMKKCTNIPVTACFGNRMMLE